MTLDAVVRWGLLLSIWLIVLSLGARASMQSAGFLLRRPAALLRALAAMFVLVPAFAILLAATAPIPAPIRFAIVAMSIAPVPPILAYKQMKAGGDEDYAVGLLVAAALASIVLTPSLVDLAARLLGAEASVPATRVTRVLVISIALPLAAGMTLRAVSNRLALAVQDGARRVGNLVLLLTFVLMVSVAWREMLDLLTDGGALAITATVAVGLLVGHVLGGTHDKGALALAAASRHPGVALAIAEMSFPEAGRTITAAILLFLLITAMVTAVYVRWMQSHGAPWTASSVGGE